MDKVEKYLINTNKVAIHVKFLLADQFRMEELKVIMCLIIETLLFSLDALFGLYHDCGSSKGNRGERSWTDTDLWKN